MDYKDKTDKFFSDRLSNFEQSPPESSWDQISAKLEKRKKNRIAFLLFRIAAGMAILISLTIGTVVLTRHEGNNSGIAGKKEISSGEKNKNKLLPRPRAQEMNNNPTHEITENKAALTKNMDAQNADNDLYVSQKEGNLHVGHTRAEVVIAKHENQDTGVNHIDNINWQGFINQPKSGHIENYPDHNLVKLSKNEAPILTEQEMIALLLGEDQIPEPAKTTSKPWLLGSEVAPLYSYRTVNSENMESKIIRNLNKNESGILAYAGGINISYSTGKRLTIQSGFYYSRYGQDKNQVETYVNRMANNEFNETSNRYLLVTNSTGTINADIIQEGINTDVRSDIGVLSELNKNYDYVSNKSLAVSDEISTDLTFRQLFDYFELPLIVRYKLIDRKIDFSVAGGVVTNLLVGNKVNIIENGRTTLTKSTSDINLINYQGSFGLGIEYPVSGKLALTLEPRFRYYINPIDKNYGIVHPFSFGLFTGINYRF